ncbi:MAG: glycosyltransferase family 32 protein [Christensenellales bacterium]
MNKITPLDISENDKLRSHYMWYVIHNLNYSVNKESAKIPRKLIQFWDNVESIPEDVRLCIDSWKLLEKQGFERLLFNDETAEMFIQDNFDRHYLDAFKCCQHPAMRADYFRLCYILREGGCYLDVDDVYKNVDIDILFRDDKLKIQPLCYDLSTDLMISAAEFMKINKYSSNLIYYVNNDPIIAPPNHPLISLALERSTKILLTSENTVKDVQSTTGPGNLTASLVRYALELKNASKDLDITLLENWDDISVPMWQLDYRKDKRNWRLWDGSDMRDYNAH